MLMKGHAASMESAVQKSRDHYRGGSRAKSRGGPGERDAGRLRPGAGGGCSPVRTKRGSCGFFELKSSIPVG